MKKVLILGAGIYQVPLIQKAQDMGLETHVASIPGAYPGFEIAQNVHHVNTTDVDAILALAQELSIDAILTAGTDVAMLSIGAVNDALGLSGPSASACLKSTDKAEMKAAFDVHGVKTARFYKTSTMEEALEKVQTLNFPIMVKAADLSGSRGIIKVDDLCSLPPAVEKVLSATRKTYFVMEEFIEGVEFGAQAFVHKGEVIMFMPHGDKLYNADTGIPVGHDVPYPLEPETYKALEETLQKAIQSLDIDNAAINADFILAPDGTPYVLEIGARSGATGLAEMVSHFYGIDYYELMLRAALGEDVSFPNETGNACFVELLFSEQSGIIETQSIQGNLPPQTEVSFDYAIGDPVRKIQNGTDRTGHIIAVAPTREEAQKRLQTAKEQINITLKGA